MGFLRDSINSDIVATARANQTTGLTNAYVPVRNVPSGEERGETDVFVGYKSASCCCENVSLQSHLNIAEGKERAWVFQRFLARIVGSFSSSCFVKS